MVKEKSKLLPVYMAVGADNLKRKTVLDRLKLRLEKQDADDIDTSVFSGESASATEIVNACNSLPFMSEYRLVIVKDAEKLGSASFAELVEYLDNPSPSTVLFLDSENLKATTTLFKKVKAYDPASFIDCKPMKSYEFTKAVKRMAQGYGIRLNDKAASALVKKVGDNTLLLDKELAKLSLAKTSSSEISAQDVDALVVQVAEVKPWEFVNAFSSGNLLQCLNCLNNMQSVSPFALLSMCVARIRELLHTKHLVNTGQTSKLASELKQPDWKVKNHVAWAHNFSEEQLVSAMRLARTTEVAMKTGKDPQTAFRDWLIFSL